MSRKKTRFASDSRTTVIADNFPWIFAAVIGLPAVALIVWSELARPANDSAAPVARVVTDGSEKRYVPFLARLVETHPRAEIRMTFAELLKTARVAVNFEDSNDGVALATLVTEEVPGRGRMAVLNVSPRALTDVSLSDTRKQMVLWHEYQHYLQLAEGRAPWESFRIRAPGSVPTSDELVVVFRAEVEAYIAETALGKELGETAWPPFCVELYRGNVAAFEHTLAAEMARWPMFRSHKELLEQLASRPYQRLEK